MIDGHLRLRIALEQREKTVPVKYVDLTKEQEKLALLSFDASSAIADIDDKKLDTLILDLQEDREELLADLGLIDMDAILFSMEGDSDYENIKKTELTVSDKPLWILIAAPKEDGVRIAKALKLRYKHCRIKNSVDNLND